MKYSKFTGLLLVGVVCIVLLLFIRFNSNNSSSSDPTSLFTTQPNQQIATQKTSPTQSAKISTEEVDRQLYVILADIYKFPIPVSWYYYSCVDSPLAVYLTQDKKLADNPTCEAEPIYELVIFVDDKSLYLPTYSGSVAKITSQKDTNSSATSDLTLEIIRSEMGAETGSRYRAYTVSRDSKFVTLLTRPTKNTFSFNTYSTTLDTIVAGMRL